MVCGERKLYSPLATLHYAFPSPNKRERQIAVTSGHMVDIEGKSIV